MIEYAHGCEAKHGPSIACAHGPACVSCMPRRCLVGPDCKDWRRVKAQHSSATEEHGTPPHIVGHGRNVMGGVIHLDPASSAFWNRRVRAEQYYTKRQNALRQRWFGNVLCNPPGDKTGKLVQAFWLRLVEFYLAGDVTQAVWVGFSLEQLASLQGIVDSDTGRTMPDPLWFPTLVPRRRLHYQEKKSATRSERSKNPPHASYVTWLPPTRLRDPTWTPAEIADHQKRLFVDEVGYLGNIVST